MDRCPRCGYEEPPIWKNRMWQLYQEYTRIEELESWPDTKELAAILRKIGPIKKGFNKVTYSDGYYNYQYRADGFVIRIAKKFAEHPDSMREPHREKGHPQGPVEFVPSLLSFIKKEREET